MYQPTWGLPRWLSGKESACNARVTGDEGLIPGFRRSPGRGHGNPLQYSCLENPMDRGAWRATVHGVAKSQTRLKRLSAHTCECHVKMAQVEKLSLPTPGAVSWENWRSCHSDRTRALFLRSPHPALLLPADLVHRPFVCVGSQPRCRVSHLLLAALRVCTLPFPSPGGGARVPRGHPLPGDHTADPMKRGLQFTSTRAQAFPQTGALGPGSWPLAQ